jgi:hypothetical protein
MTVGSVCRSLMIVFEQPAHLSDLPVRVLVVVLLELDLFVSSPVFRLMSAWVDLSRSILVKICRPLVIKEIPLIRHLLRCSLPQFLRIPVGFLTPQRLVLLPLCTQACKLILSPTMTMLLPKFTPLRFP